MGQVTALNIVSQPAPADVLPGYVVNDLLIDFSGQYTGSQMVVALTSGSIYQNTSPLGSRTPPPAAAIPIEPALQWDTFVANGGPTAETTIGQFLIGRGEICAHCFPIEDENTFTDESIDQTWSPAGGNVILDQTGFMVARVTLSDDANGLLQYLGSADQIIGVGQPGRIEMLPIRNGFIVPEPSTVGLLVVACAAVVAVQTRSPLAPG